MSYRDDCTLPAEKLEHITSEISGFVPEPGRIPVNAAVQIVR
jgi:hypothetical protein